jgi:hypothetical protein
MTEDTRDQDPMPGLRRRIRSLGIVGLLVGIVYAMTVISDPPVEGVDAVHPWVALALTLYALTSAPRRGDAPFGTPGGHLLRGGIWVVLAASAGWNLVQHGSGDTLLLVVGALTIIVALANAAVRLRLSQARPTP